MKLVGVGVLCFVAACGDKHATDPTDAPRPLDAPPIDARLSPETPPCPFNDNYSLEDHGEIRIELVHSPGGQTGARATAFVYDDVSAPFYPFLNLNGCTDVTAQMHRPIASYPSASYRDPGQVLISGGAQPLQLTRESAGGVDSVGRMHPPDAWFTFDTGPAAAEAAKYLAPNAGFSAAFTGTSSLPGQVFTDALYMPPTFDLITPGMDSLAIPSAPTELTFEFTHPAGTPQNGSEVASWITFVGSEGPIVVCAEPLDGSMTVPAALVTLVRAKAGIGGTLVREALSTVPRQLDDGAGPRVDANGCPVSPAIWLTGSNRYESAFDIDP